ncbi:hypothetical protein [Anaeromyxobacter oryzae]|uniref:Glycosyltransferase RgtA/B/C/D-like domain-containing protein n=1 Tax=Anaeromyxobacter oryzae TaxID=2918170 RepID=A0ABM7WNV3_9BACT|nr:hypothetical protein [Anaeromyxobacter oryzae]BDG01137.1 hypothetical protein AMOR_01330 [Anaeromyxobacter oryzae]
MIVPLLLAVWLAALALALALARQLRPAERAVLALATALLAAAAILSPFAAIHDAWAHYMHLRDVPKDPRAILFPWDRPGFVLLQAGPAAFGYRAARLAAIVPALVALAATMLAARRLGLVRPWAAGLLVLAQYDFFGQGASTMTELPFAAALAVAALGWAEDRPWLVAAGLGWMGITRPEGPAFVAAGAAAILWRWRDVRPAAAAFAPFALYWLVGALAYDDVRWMVTESPYRGLVGVRVGWGELVHSYFFTALKLSQPPVLVVLEALGAALALLGPARALRFLLPPIALLFLLLSFLRIGLTDAWRESRYLVEIAPALGLLAAAGLEAALARLPRLAPPLLLAYAAWGAAGILEWYWVLVGVRAPGFERALFGGLLALAAALWLARRLLAPTLALGVLLVIPLAALPPGALSRHRPDIRPSLPDGSPDLRPVTPARPPTVGPG